MIGSAKELEALAGTTVDDLHSDVVDKITIEKDGKTYQRIPDVLDVWVDAGTALWNCLRMQEEDEVEYVPIEFIVEGKDQIRGWFNLLHICGNVGFGKKAFKTCYMHGYINDTSGRKMSKSLKNYIKPAEVTEKFGADTFRMYAIGGTNPGLDLNYNFDDVELRQRNLNVLWNVHRYALDMAQTNGFTSRDMPAKSREEEYILSRLHETIASVRKKFDVYKLDDIPTLIESFFLELSRTYIQLVRDKASTGTQEEKQTVFATLVTCLDAVTKLLAPITPYVSEQLYQNMKELPGFEKESVHFESYPVADETQINQELEDAFAIAQTIITNGLAARDKAKLGVRWPSAKITLDVEDKFAKLVKNMEDLIKQQLNVKAIEFEKIPVQYVVKPNYRNLGKAFGQQTADVLTLLKDKEKEKAVADAISAEKESFVVGDFEFSADMFDVEVIPQDGATVILFDEGKLELDTGLTPELEAEGFSREVTRRLQNLRKTAGLQKADTILVEVKLGDLPEAVLDYKDAIMETCGAKELSAVQEVSFSETSDEKVKGKSFALAIKKL